METKDNTQTSTRSSEQISQIEEACRLYEGLSELQHSLESNINAIEKGGQPPTAIAERVKGYLERANTFQDVPLIMDLAGKVQENYWGFFHF